MCVSPLCVVLAAIALATGTEPADKSQGCSHTVCSVECEGIDDSTAVLTDYLNDVQCQKACGQEGLKVTIRRSTFMNNELSNDWLNTLASITELQIIDCALEAIHPGAFEGEAFQNLSKLTLQENNIRVFTKDTFLGLFALIELNIVENKDLESMEDGILDRIANSLEILLIQKTLTNSGVLKNITGSNTVPRLVTVDLRYNEINELKDNVFVGLTGVHSLHLTGSKIKTIDPGAFRSLVSLSQLDLNQNKLTSLPEGVFDDILSMARPPKVFLSNNSWHCICSFVWFQQILLQNDTTIGKETPPPACGSPEENVNKSIVEAEFCTETSLAPTSTTPEILPTSPSTTSDVPDTTIAPVEPPTSQGTTSERPPPSTNPSEETTEEQSTLSTEQSPPTLSCREYSENDAGDVSFSGRKPMLVNSPYVRLPRIQTVTLPVQPLNFAIEEVDADYLNIRINATDKEGYLTWYPSGSVDHTLPEDSGCYYTTPKSMIKICQLKADQSYLICFVINQDVSCGSIKTMPEYNNRPWLTNGEMVSFIALFTVMSIICATCCLCIVFKWFNDANSPSYFKKCFDSGSIDSSGSIHSFGTIHKIDSPA